MTIAQVKDFWNRQPCNSRRSKHPVGTPEWAEDVIANKFRAEPHIMDFLAPWDWGGREVLDAGCGIGIMAQLLAGSGARVTACDLSAQSLGLAERLCALRGQDVQFLLKDLEAPWPHWYHGRFDLVWSFGVLHHTPYPQAALSGLRKVIRPGGTLKIMLYHRPSWKTWQLLWKQPWGAFRYGIDWAVARGSEAQTGCPLTRTYTRASARALVEGAGFRVTQIQVAHIFPYYIPAYIHHKYQKEWYWRLVPGPLFRWLERSIGWHLLITAVPN